MTLPLPSPATASTAVVESLLTIRDLHVTFATPRGQVQAVRGVDLELRRGEILALVGESGSGKSVTAMAIVGLNRAANTFHRGEVRYRDQDLLAASQKQLRALRGAEIAMVFQDPLSSLNPLHRVGRQITEMVRLHSDASRKQAWRRAVELLDEVGIPNPATRADAYPHEFSGGMRQRVMIAMALACNPKVLIADEPTTALDVTIQAQVLELIKGLRRKHAASVLLITHDLGVVADVADTVAVMYAGRIVERGPAHEVFANPQHPYTWGLLASVPRVDRPRGSGLRSIPGAPPSLLDPPAGCAFRPRCGSAFDRCIEVPPLEQRLRGRDHPDACWLHPEEKAAARHAVLAEEEPE